MVGAISDVKGGCLVVNGKLLKNNIFIKKMRGHVDYIIDNLYVGVCLCFAYVPTRK